jgi:hypothetical protein
VAGPPGTREDRVKWCTCLLPFMAQGGWDTPRAPSRATRRHSVRELSKTINWR